MDAEFRRRRHQNLAAQRRFAQRQPPFDWHYWAFWSSGTSLLTLSFVALCVISHRFLAILRSGLFVDSDVFLIQMVFWCLAFFITSFMVLLGHNKARVLLAYGWAFLVFLLSCVLLVPLGPGCLFVLAFLLTPFFVLLTSKSYTQGLSQIPSRQLSGTVYSLVAAVVCAWLAWDVLPGFLDPVLGGGC